MSQRRNAGEQRDASPLRSARTSWRPHRGWSIAFGLYALALAAATHWPDVRIPGPDELHPDKLVHLAAFGLWTALLLRSGLLGPWRSWGARWRTLGALLFYAVVDEVTQAIPGLHRQVSHWDVAANVIGGVAALTAMWLLAENSQREG
ncbi:MAG: VanZ family protein [Planctomycetota bacterium]|nr:MAG: VanZ family protein [Planctomycetota bacterium]